MLNILTGAEFPIEWINTGFTNIASGAILILEFFGIVTILLGAIIAFSRYCLSLVNNRQYHIKVKLANCLATGLEFKMGAEIIKTTVIRTNEELVILGAIIVLRALLAFLIHWEIKSEVNMNEEVIKKMGID